MAMRKMTEAEIARFAAKPQEDPKPKPQRTEEETKRLLDETEWAMRISGGWGK